MTRWPKEKSQPASLESSRSYLSPGHKDVNECVLIRPRTLHGLVQTVSEVALLVPGTPHWRMRGKRT